MFQKIALFLKQPQPSKVRWFALTILALAPLLPSDFVGHSHWDIVRWIPFQDFMLTPKMLTDVIGNILWFIPFGYLLYYQLDAHSPTLSSMTVLVILTGGVSLSIELFQVFCHNRIPAMTDVICNVLGASLGGYVAMKPRANIATQLWPDSGVQK